MIFRLDLDRKTTDKLTELLDSMKVSAREIVQNAIMAFTPESEPAVDTELVIEPAEQDAVMSVVNPDKPVTDVVVEDEAEVPKKKRVRKPANQ